MYSLIPDADYQRLFESAPTPLMVLTPAFVIVAVNAAFIDASMKDRESLIGQCVFDVFPDNPDDPAPNGSQSLRLSLNRVLESRKTDVMPVVKYDVRRPAADGGAFEERYWCPVNSPMLNNQGELVYILQQVEDVTSYVKLQNSRTQLEDHSVELQERAQRMESEVFLHSQQVAEANHRLQEANDELRTLTYSVAHDLGAPLRAINSFARLLCERNQDLDAESQRLLKVVNENALTMGRLIESLLLFNSIGNKTLDQRQVDMNELIGIELAALRKPEHDAHQIHVLDLPPACGDQMLMRQVWRNLLSNALTFTGRTQQVRIDIGSYKDGSFNVFYIKDNGVGFDMAHADKLFGVFQRLHHQDEYPGTGIGLALVQRIVKRHGGQVWAEGRLGEGASFYFALPAIG